VDLFTAEVKYLKGVGEHRAKLLAKLGVRTYNDLLEFFPRDYIQREAKSSIGELESGSRSSVTGKIVSILENVRGNQRKLNMVITDGENELLCTWFRYGNWLKDMIKEGDKVWVSGVISSYRNRFQLVHPELEVLDKDEDTTSFWHSRSVLPVYHLTDKLKIWQMRNIIYNIFRLHADEIEETLSEGLLERFGWLPRRISLQKIHFSTEPEKVPRYKERYAFEAVLSRLTLPQVRVIRALAAHPTQEILSGEFVGRCGLPPSSVQFARDRLKTEDLISQEEPKKTWNVVDPVFSMWLKRL